MAYFNEDPEGWPMLSCMVWVAGKKWNRALKDRELMQKLDALACELEALVLKRALEHGWVVQPEWADGKYYWPYTP